jgi:hypothetical protein
MAGDERNPEVEQEVQLPDSNRPEVMHEERDINAWAIGKFGIALVLLCGLALLVLVGLFKYFQSEEEANQPAAPVRVDARRLPPEPRLQDTPILDLEAMRAAEDRLLNGYGWVDQNAGVARVPVSVAIDALAKQGLPARPQAEATSASNATVPTESGMGWIMQQFGGPLAGTGGHAPEPPPPPVRSSYETGIMPAVNPPPKYYETPVKK